MKIIYSAGNRPGADILLYRFMQNNDHEVKTAAYIKSSESSINIDWTLDAIYNKYTGCNRGKLVDLFGRKNLPMMGFEEIGLLIDDVTEFKPDLIICDYEPILANIAKSLNIKLWYCSPVHLLDGIIWQDGQMKHTGLLEVCRKNLPKLPEPDKVLVHSPFGIIEGTELKNGYEWVMPESSIKYNENDKYGICITNDSYRVSELSKILNCIPPFDLTLFSQHKYDLSHLESCLLSNKDNYEKAISFASWVFCTGETSFITDALLAGVNRLSISPDLQDPEALLNATMVSLYNLGDNLGQVEYLERYSIETIEESYLKRFDKRYKIKNINIPTLKEKL